jgi:hypothetical protein
MPETAEPEGEGETEQTDSDKAEEDKEREQAAEPDRSYDGADQGLPPTAEPTEAESSPSRAQEQEVTVTAADYKRRGLGRTIRRAVHFRG